ncbi:ras-associating and dilute domain-containing protein-like isoform X2 [Denticeps clupeoides]|uniref:Ras-associating and dilute domain-containing protein n=1 Tax=Denticeps clupeoides TaxID=299321 RepID=A0AAY4C010_9TELE|nr:ras-associating and dilute domain-containing protein-like isoform X2 [Denticeps clupeoides]
MISEERSNLAAKPALGFPVGLLITSPRKRLARLGRKPSDGSLTSSVSDGAARSAESTGVRQPAKSRIRRHNNRLSTVFSRSPVLRQAARGPGADLPVDDDPAELSIQLSAPGILKIFGSDVCQGTNYKSVLATTRSSAKELVKEALERYSLEKEDAGVYVLCDVIGRPGTDSQWRAECYRVVGDHEKPLVLQALWKPKEGFSRRFEIQRRSSLEKRGAQDTVTAGLNAQARKLQKVRSRVTSLFVDAAAGDVDDLGIWRSLSDMDVSAMGTEACRVPKAQIREDPEAEKEETESSDDASTQFSVHPPFDFPYFLLLQGYSHRQDFVIYLIGGSSCVFGSGGEDEEDATKVDVLLFAPDVLPRHCRVRRRDWGGGGGALTLLQPMQGSSLSHNGVPLSGEAELKPGDLVGMGQYYLFMFKDPTGAGTAPPPAWATWLRPPGEAAPCRTCAAPAPPSRPLPQWRDLDGRRLVLPYQVPQEERLVRDILGMVDPAGDEPKLTPAFLLCLCIRHSAAHFQLPALRRLLLRISSQIQLLMWERTKELAAVQPDRSPGEEVQSQQQQQQQQQGPDDVELLGLADLVPALRPLVMWMANSIELLHFIHHEVPLLLPWRQTQEEQQVQTGDLADSEMVAMRTASEEAMTVLEEVIMFTFQQTVYYLTKSMYAALPGLLDSNPFSESGQLRAPAGVCAVLDVLEEALQLLNTFQVHSEIASQLLAYLFFFTNASVFNALMERGSGGGFYQWSRGVQVRANLDLLMDWIHGIGLGDLAVDFFQKLSAAVNLLATPKETLFQASWSSLRAEFQALNPAQLHHMLREYNPGRVCPAHWTPSPEDAEAALTTSQILESFDSHPPLILPSSTFHLELGKPVCDPRLFLQLQRLLESRQAAEDLQSSLVKGPSDAISASSLIETPSAQVRGFHGDLSCCQAGLLTQKLKNLELQSSLAGEASLDLHKSLALDPSCLLTPPNTPQGLELAELEASMQEGAAQHRKGCADLRKVSSEEEEHEDVFTVELHRGPHGLGLALVDGMKTPLRMSGIYIKSVIPDSPAALCRKLNLGDRVLAVNGTSLVGMDYETGRELIRSSGDSLRLLVARSCGRTSVTRC